MPLQQAVVQKSSSRVEALRAKHKSLSKKIKSEQGRPFLSEHLLSELKRKKLKLKEEIEGIRKAY